MVVAERERLVQDRSGGGLRGWWLDTAATALQNRTLAKESAWQRALEGFLQGGHARAVQNMVGGRLDETLAARGIPVSGSWFNSVHFESWVCISRAERILSAPDAERKLAVAVEFVVSPMGDMSGEVTLESSAWEWPHCETLFLTRSPGIASSGQMPRSVRSRMDAVLLEMACNPTFAKQLDHTCHVLDEYLCSHRRERRAA